MIHHDFFHIAAIQIQNDHPPGLHWSSLYARLHRCVAANAAATRGDVPWQLVGEKQSDASAVLSGG